MGREEGEVEDEEDEAVFAAVVGEGERFEARYICTLESAVLEGVRT